MTLLTQELVKELFDYDPLTGIFIKKMKIGKKGRIGDRADFVFKTNRSLKRQVTIYSKHYLAHRIAWLYMTGVMPKNQIDHINGDQMDNRFENLREATNQQNSFNRGARITSKSGIRGVSWSKAAKKWMAMGCINGKSKYLGIYESLDDARKAYHDFSIREHGEFSYVNK